MTFTTAIKTCFIKYFDFWGRASRAEFWYFVLFYILLSLCGDAIDAALAGVSYLAYDEVYGPLVVIIDVVLFIPSIAVGARRLHDIGKSGWWQLLCLTVIGIILLIIWFATKTDPRHNRYGAPAIGTSQPPLPYDESQTSRPSTRLGWLKPVLIVVAVLLAAVLLLGGLILLSAHPNVV